MLKKRVVLFFLLNLRFLSAAQGPSGLSATFNAASAQYPFVAPQNAVGLHSGEKMVGLLSPRTPPNAPVAETLRLACFTSSLNAPSKERYGSFPSSSSFLGLVGDTSPKPPMVVKYFPVVDERFLLSSAVNMKTIDVRSDPRSFKHVVGDAYYQGGQKCTDFGVDIIEVGDVRITDALYLEEMDALLKDVGVGVQVLSIINVERIKRLLLCVYAKKSSEVLVRYEIYR